MCCVMYIFSMVIIMVYINSLVMHTVVHGEVFH